jgi:hypothetical protein
MGPHIRIEDARDGEAVKLPQNLIIDMCVWIMHTILSM